MKRLAWILAAAMLFVGTVLIELPASLVVALAWPHGIPVVLEDVRGSVWRGQATQVRWHERTLGSLAWTARPSALLLGRLDLQLRLSGETKANARVVRGLRWTGIRNLDATFTAHWLQGQPAGNALRAEGRVQATLPSATIKGGRITALAGELVWRDASLRGATSAALGTLHARFSLANDQCVHGTVADQGGPLSVSGGYTTDLSAYRIRLLLAARDPRTASAIQWLGQPGRDGQRSLLLGHGALPGRCQAIAGEIDARLPRAHAAPPARSGGLPQAPSSPKPIQTGGPAHARQH